MAQSPEQGGAGEGLKRKNPVFRLCPCPVGVAVADLFHRGVEEEKRKKNQERRGISYPVGSHIITHFMDNKTMSLDKTQDANPEQLLKLLEMQVTAARERRAARETGRRTVGTVGLIIIIGGAAFALWMLSLLLGQMRPARGGNQENADGPAAEISR